MPRTNTPENQSAQSGSKVAQNALRAAAHRLLHNAEMTILGLTSTAGRVSMVDQSTMVGPEAFLAAPADPLFRTTSTNTEESLFGRYRSELVELLPSWQSLRAEGPLKYIKARWHAAIAPLPTKDAERDAEDWTMLKCCESEDFAHVALSGLLDFPRPKDLSIDNIVSMTEVRQKSDASCDALPLGGKFEPLRMFVDLEQQTDDLPPLLYRDAGVWTKEAKAANAVSFDAHHTHNFVHKRDIGLLKAHQDFGINVHPHQITTDKNTSM